MDSKALAQSFVKSFIRSEFVTDYINETTEAGAYSQRSEARDRFERCHDAAANGADGMTHYEVINDWRSAFRDLMRRRKHPICRFAEAIEARFNELESWHETNGSLHNEIG